MMYANVIIKCNRYHFYPLNHRPDTFPNIPLLQAIFAFFSPLVLKYCSFTKCNRYYFYNLLYVRALYGILLFWYVDFLEKPGKSSLAFP